MTEVMFCVTHRPILYRSLGRPIGRSDYSHRGLLNSFGERHIIPYRMGSASPRVSPSVIRRARAKAKDWSSPPQWEQGTSAPLANANERHRRRVFFSARRPAHHINRWIEAHPMRADFRLLTAHGWSDDKSVSAASPGTTPQDGKMAGEVDCSRPYGRVAIGLHWVSAVTILTLWLIGQFNGFLPRGPLRLGIWSTHVFLGFVLALVVAVRIYWRLRHPSGETQDRGLLYAFAELVHHALYGLMATVIALGLANAFLRGYSMFGVWSLPKLPGLLTSRGASMAGTRSPQTPWSLWP
jgi:cytochrome b561